METAVFAGSAATSEMHWQLDQRGENKENYACADPDGTYNLRLTTGPAFDLDIPPADPWIAALT